MTLPPFFFATGPPPFSLRFLCIGNIKILCKLSCHPSAFFLLYMGIEKSSTLIKRACLKADPHSYVQNSYPIYDYKEMITSFFAFSGNSSTSRDTLKTKSTWYFSLMISNSFTASEISCPSRQASFKKLSKNISSRS